MVSAVNETFRDNVFYMPGNGTSTYAILGAQLAQRGTYSLPVTGGRGLQQYLLRTSCAALIRAASD